MFTGIVEELGEVVEAGDGRLVVRCRTVLGDSSVGASLCVNGVCLTVVERDQGALGFDLSPETVARSALGALSPGSTVNLERPVSLTTRLGGHLVQGHVDAVGRIVSVNGNETGCEMVIEAPETVLRYVVEKGSIAVDGVSLTVAAVNGSRFWVALIPHTLRATTFGRASAGDAVNLEADVMAKYVERLVKPYA